jgi:hypothetical protein
MVIFEGIMKQAQQTVIWGTDFLIQLMRNRKIQQVSGVYTELWTRPEDVDKYKYKLLSEFKFINIYLSLC